MKKRVSDERLKRWIDTSDDWHNSVITHDLMLDLRDERAEIQRLQEAILGAGLSGCEDLGNDDGWYCIWCRNEAKSPGLVDHCMPGCIYAELEADAEKEAKV